MIMHIIYTISGGLISQLARQHFKLLRLVIKVLKLFKLKIPTVTGTYPHFDVSITVHVIC